MGKKLTAEEIAELSKDSSQGFDQCSVCQGWEKYMSMESLTEDDDGRLICDECAPTAPDSVRQGNKKEFHFFLDQKVTTWYRTNFTIEAENEEEAKKNALEFHEQGKTEDIGWEQQDDVNEVMDVEDNDGNNTEELYYAGLNGGDADLIYQNGNG